MWSFLLCLFGRSWHRFDEKREGYLSTEFFAAVCLQFPFFWDMLLHQWISGSKCSQETYCHHLQPSKCSRRFRPLKMRTLLIWQLVEAASYPSRIDARAIYRLGCLLDALKYVEALVALCFKSQSKGSKLFYTVQAKQTLLVPCTTTRCQDLSHQSEQHIDIPNVSRFLSADFRWILSPVNGDPENELVCKVV